jgi:nicotinic acid mononucleotide adenylyltransferase
MDFRQFLELTEADYGVVLVATGAYNPIHRGHIKVFYHAKRFLASKGIQVVAAYLVPRNYSYIQKKSVAKGETPIDNQDRQKMIQIATQGTFIQVLPLEDNDNGQMLGREQIREYIKSMPQHRGQEVLFVAGDDKAECPTDANSGICLRDLQSFGKTVIVGRKLAGDASSTQVRNNIKQFGDEPELLSPGVRSFIKDKGLYSGGAKPQ